MCKVKKRLHSKSGETLVEAIISILLLAILLGTVTAMIHVSLNLTARALEEATELQNDTFNPAIFGTHDDYEQGEITFVTPATSTNIATNHDIYVFEIADDIVSFIPDIEQFED